MRAQDFGLNRWIWEPSLDDLLNDPTMHAFLVRDRLSVDHVRTLVKEVRQRLARAA
jgi:hypothetical protein